MHNWDQAVTHLETLKNIIGGHENEILGTNKNTEIPQIAKVLNYKG